MDKCQWYMTVGYPGGEFAFQDAQLLAKRIGFLLGDFFGPLLNVEKDGNVKYIGAVPCIRPCPPDLAEWLDTPMKHGPPDYVKVPGGWLYRDYDNYNAGEQHSSIFIPVRGADGITVLEDSDAN